MFGIFKRDNTLKKENDKLKDQIHDLEMENLKMEEKVADIQDRLDDLPHQKRLKKLEDAMSNIPSGARGGGNVTVFENEMIKGITIGDKNDMMKVIEKAKTGKLEILFS